MRHFVKAIQAGKTRWRLLDCGVELLEAGGLGALSLRALARAATVTLGCVQFHFHTREEMASEVVAHWRRRITNDVADAAKEMVGLDRVLYLCRWFLAYGDDFVVAIEAARKAEPSGELDAARTELRKALEDWVELTRRALRQARLRGELRGDVDIQALALELHRWVWSPWSVNLYGQAGSNRLILEGIWDCVAAGAVDPQHVLPPRAVFVDEAPPVSTAPLVEPPPPEANPASVPDWRVFYEPSDPLFHAYERHELMEDPRSLAAIPTITEHDVAAAEAYNRRTQTSQPGATG